MVNLTITPMLLKGDVVVPPSKSACHRAVICAALSEGTSKLERVLLSEDITATVHGMEALGAHIHQEGDTLTVQGVAEPWAVEDHIDCGESGSTLRFLIPLALHGSPVAFTGRGRLVERPLTVYHSVFTEQGIPFKTQAGRLPLTVAGRLKPGRFLLPGNVSSQFVTGLLFALPLLDGDSEIVLTSELESEGYVDLTLAILADFGIRIERPGENEFSVPGRQRYRSRDYRVEGDYSQAAFWLVAGILGRSVRCLELSPDSKQGDKVVVDIIRRMGGLVTVKGNALLAQPGPLSGTVIDASQCPDLVPVLTVLAAVSEGETRIVRAARLRLKESDRLKTIASELNKLGADVREGEDSLTINGRPCLTGGVVDSWQDHRIAMALAVASLKCRQPVTIQGSECVAKSYPHFWQDFQKLGGVLR